MTAIPAPTQTEQPIKRARTIRPISPIPREPESSDSCDDKASRHEMSTSPRSPIILKSPKVNKPTQGFNINIGQGNNPVNYSTEFNTIRTTGDATNRFELQEQP